MSQMSQKIGIGQENVKKKKVSGTKKKELGNWHWVSNMSRNKKSILERPVKLHF